MEKETYWSRFADSMDEGSNYVVGKVDIDIILSKIAEMKDLKKTLELGCGSGIYSKVIAHEATEFFATDFSDEMVSTTQNRLKHLPNILVEKQNSLNLSYRDDTFDTVIMANLLHIIPDPEKAIAEAGRVLKPGGSIIVISYTTDGMKFFHKLGMFYRFIKTWGKPSPYARTLKLAATAEMITSKGFEVSRSELIGYKSKAVFISAAKKQSS